ncbi:MAG: hypothetical protein GY719_14825 [bacterium]|nr:hypothetical protein [bacterium]
MNTKTNHLNRPLSIRHTAHKLVLAALLLSSLAVTGCNRLDDWGNRDPSEYETDPISFFHKLAEDDLRSA